MARVKDFYTYLDKICPFSIQESWDNSGMLVGDENREVTRAAVVLDITSEVIEYASQVGVDLIISHHPVIFKAQKNILKGNLVYSLIRNDISAIGVHTCLDCADGGVNDVLAEILELENVEIFPCEESANIVRAGVLPEAMDAESLAHKLKEELGGNVRYCDCGKKIESVAVCGGSATDFIPDIIKSGFDAYITGDAGHHNFLDCIEGGVSLFAAGHFETENPVVSYLASKLRCEFSDIDIIIIPQKSPIKTI